MDDSLPRVLGPYVLLARLGRGAAGEAFLARPIDPASDLPVPLVVKCLHQRLTDREIFVRRFRHESRIAVCVDSPHVAQVLDAGACGDVLYISMEYVSGMPVAQVLHKMQKTETQPDPSTAVAMAMQALEGLHALHTARDASGQPLEVVHRDVSPRNIMVGDNGVVQLIDLGLGKSKAQDWRTKTGMVLGSLGYMPQEQIRAEAVDQRADIYAVGVILFELLTCRRYIKNDSMAEMVEQTIMKQFTPPSQFRSELPSSLDAVLERALEHTPNARYPSARDFQKAMVSEPCGTTDAIATFIRGLDEAEQQRRIRSVNQLLAVPLPDEPPLERTAVFAARTRANEKPVEPESLPPLVSLLPTDVAPSPLSTKQKRSTPTDPISSAPVVVRQIPLRKPALLLVVLGALLILVVLLFVMSMRTNPAPPPTAPAVTPEPQPAPRIAVVPREEQKEPAPKSEPKRKTQKLRAVPSRLVPTTDSPDPTFSTSHPPARELRPPKKQRQRTRTKEPKKAQVLPETKEAAVKRIQKRAAVLRERGSTPELTRWLTKLSLVRHVKDPDKAREQIAALEQELKQLEETADR